MKRTSIAAIAALLLTLAGLGGLYWYQQRATPPREARAPQQEPPAPAAPAPAVAEPAIKHPIDTALAASAPPPSLGGGDANAAWRAALNDLVGSSAAVRFLQTEDFSRRLVVTVDNLARAHAAPRLWPVNPVPGRFSVQVQGDTSIPAATNPGRYAPLVGMLANLDARRVAALYVRAYPQLQKTYEELGYPGRYFNDRVVEVIDHLLQTPEPDQPLQITLTEVKGEVASAQPWLRYEFADPALQALSSGQKMLLRVDAAQRATLKAKLGELRALVARGPATR